MKTVRQSLVGLFIALISIALLWMTWLAGQAEDFFAASQSENLTCQYPTGWAPYSLQAEDDLARWTEETGYSLEEILASNCLPANANLPVDDRIFLPIEIMELITPACGPPEGWGYYLTNNGDSLSTLAAEFEIRVDQLRLANCFVGESDFEPGMRIFAPASALATLTLAPSATAPVTPESESAATTTGEP